jgi:lambda family phage portal protein
MAETPDIGWGPLDRALALVSPRVAARRYAARVALGNMRRAYDGAQKGRRTDGWRTAGTAADAEIAAAGGILRDRMRDLVRNNPLAARAVSVLVNNLVGSGIRPRAATADPAMNEMVDKLWTRWAEQCDADGHTDFHGLTSLAVREMIEGGEVFAIRRRRRMADRLPVPCQVELKEADHLDGARFGDTAAGSRVAQGIEYDREGRRSAYWLFPDHPGDRSPTFGRRMEAVRVEAGAVAHLYERQRVQSRGVPWGTPAIRALRDVDDWQNAELVRKKTEACLVGIVFGAEEDQQSIAPVIQDADGNRVEQFEPGLIAYARGGKDIKFNQPASTSGVYEWHRVQLHIIAAGFRVPYELMTGDLSQVNFSSIRAGLNEFRRMIDAMQWQIVIPGFCAPVWRWFLDAAFTAGLIPTVDVPAEWAPPSFESVNPLQDAQTDLLETRAGFATLPQQIAKRGYDPKKVLAEYAECLALADGLGLVLDSDPRKVSQAGLTQPRPTEETTPEKGAS